MLNDLWVDYSVNTTSRLAPPAAPGEVLLSESVYADIASEWPGLEVRNLALRGKAAPVAVRVARPSHR